MRSLPERFRLLLLAGSLAIPVACTRDYGDLFGAAPGPSGATDAGTGGTTDAPATEDVRDAPAVDSGGDSGRTCSAPVCADRCAITCVEGCPCTEVCPLGEACNLDCQRGATCNLACPQGAEGCNADCRAGSTCRVDCARGPCEVRCERGATCSVKCGGSGSCDIECSDGEEDIDCPDGIKACGRCP